MGKEAQARQQELPKVPAITWRAIGCRKEGKVWHVTLLEMEGNVVKSAKSIQSTDNLLVARERLSILFEEQVLP